MYKYYLFDLDGTIIDSSLGITKAAKYALNKMNIEIKETESLLKFIGPPLYDSFKEYGFNDEEIKKAIEFFREYFRPYGVHENELYEGIEDVFKNLKKQNKKLIICTSKLEEFTIQILKEKNIYSYFDFIGAASKDGKISKKEDVVRYVLQSNNLPLEECVMIGDRKFDIYGAKINSIDSIGVTYGFGSEEELKDEGATYIASSPKEILLY